MSTRDVDPVAQALMFIGTQGGGLDEMSIVDGLCDIAAAIRRLAAAVERHRATDADGD